MEARSQICFSLRTKDFTEAKLKAAQISYDLEQEWRRAVELGISLKNRRSAERFAAAVQAQTRLGLKPTSSIELSDEDLLDRLRILISGTPSKPDQKAVLGLVEKPDLSMMDAFERFLAHIEDEWSGLSRDQGQVKRNGYLKALSNFRHAVGDLDLCGVDQHHAWLFGCGGLNG